jgi:GNAT superfamily N-acetyltransferase
MKAKAAPDEMTGSSENGMQTEREAYMISTEFDRLDLDFICRSLNATYWAAQRTREVIVASLRNSLCFGLYRKEPGEQIGFCRVVTDRATFSWLCDVMVDERYRGHGLGKWLVEFALSHPAVQGTTFYLGTRDAHGLYEKYGFKRSELMRRPRPGN